MQLIVHNPIGWSKWISRSLTLHIGSCRESLFGESVVVSIQMWFIALLVVAVVMAADSGIVGKISRSSGDCIIELLIRIHRYSTDSDKLTMLIWSSKIRLGEFSWKWKSKQRHCTTRPACVSENKLPSLLIHRITLHHHHHATVEQKSKALPFSIEKRLFLPGHLIGDQSGFSLIKFQVTALFWVRENLNNSLCGEVKVDDYELIQKQEKPAENRFHVDAIKPEASAREDASVVAS